MQVSETVIKELSKNIESLNRRLKALEGSKKKTWVSVFIIQEVTGWKGSFMRSARENGLVQYDKENNKYLLESIHPNFLKQKTPIAVEAN